MLTCQFEPLIIEYLSHSLPDSEKALFESHLRQCPSCSTQLNDLTGVHQLLLKRERPAPDAELVQRYENNLKARFKPESLFTRISAYPKKLLVSFFEVRTIRFRLAPVIGVLILGIVIGRFFLPSSSPDSERITPPNIIVVSLQPTDLKMIQQYLLESEMLLLDIQNNEGNESFKASGAQIKQELAQRLLQRQSFIQEKAQLLNSPALSQFLVKLELLLLEVSNSDTSEIKEAFETIGNSIKENNLLYDVNKFQNVLTFTSGTGI